MYVSLRDVVARSGASFQAAGKVLDGAPEILERVLRAVADRGYVPNATARRLAGRIGVVADEFSDLAVSRFVPAARRWPPCGGVRRRSAPLTLTTPPGRPFAHSHCSSGPPPDQ